MKSRVNKLATGSEVTKTKDSHIFGAKEMDFKHFDIVIDYSDHYYSATKDKKIMDSDCFTNPSSAVHKKIMQEWKILDENLPESIYVRVYENKINLLRAVIIGASGTPYHDGLFFFDLAFPSDYPNTPPRVNFLLHGLRLNPNLYNSGRVCLSLLNTWSGSSQEVWLPEKSTILQLLLSIQALVLNEDPFFNEPCYSNQKSNPAYRDQSSAYADNAYLLSCKLMQYLINNTPKNFESFVRNYFCKRAHFILAAYNAYRNAEAKVGCFQSSSCASTKVSLDFKKSMDTLYPDLVNAIERQELLVWRRTIIPERLNPNPGGRSAKLSFRKSNLGEALD